MKILALKTEIPSSPGWLLVGTPWVRCDNLGWPQHHKKCQEKPTAIQTWQMVQLVNSYLKQVGTRPDPGSHTSKRRKLNARFSLVRRTNYISIFPSLGLVWVSESGSVWQKLHIPVWMWDLFGCWKFCCEAHCPAVTNCHTGPGLAGAGWKQQSTTCQENRIRRITMIIIIRQNTVHNSAQSPPQSGVSRQGKKDQNQS